MLNEAKGAGGGKEGRRVDWEVESSNQNFPFVTLGALNS
jgi:hypothetical protein